ncbi:MAG: hypothetical protein ACT4NY_18260 [Pseudonocardiales bacterium]
MELAALGRWWRTSERAAVVWGRRRVGKTALLQQFASALDAPVIFRTGVGRPAAGEVAQLARQVAATVDRSPSPCPKTRPKSVQNECNPCLAGAGEPDYPL